MTEFHCPASEVGLVSGTDFAADSLDIGVDGARADSHPGGRLCLSEALGNVSQNFPLPRSEAARLAWPPGRGPMRGRRRAHDVGELTGQVEVTGRDGLHSLYEDIGGGALGQVAIRSGSDGGQHVTMPGRGGHHQDRESGRKVPDHFGRDPLALQVQVEYQNV
ncbi:MAG: hypothetical protein M3Y33_01175 [Actinomycetota bacterium]|nr:hypothetical protein [Actinomycetota bacterium]